MEMKPALKRLTVLCAGAMLLACADLAERFAPLPEQLAARSADDAYLLGRNYHLARRYEDAFRSYRAALAVDPAHVNANNGLATIYAERRAFAQAIPIWRSLTDKLSMSSGPGGAYLFSNLGYAYFLSGDYENAVIALEKACVLDPLSHRAWHHLGEALQKVGQEQRAREMFRQAEALQQHDLRDDVAAAGTASAAVEAAVQTGERSGVELDGSQITQRPDGTLELRRVPLAQGAARTIPIVAEPLPVPLPEPASALPGEAQVALLEIRNGNGVTGMAKSIKLRIDDPGYKVVRLTNEKGFNVRQTRIEYHGPFRSAAERLAQRFDNASVVEVDAGQFKRTDMLLVIGRDIARPNFTLRPPVRPVNGPAIADRSGPGKSG